MKSLVEIYDDIDHKCNEESISDIDKAQMLWSAAQEYFENLQKSDRWKSIIKFDIEFLKIHSFRRDGHYSFGAETFLIFLIREVERYGFNIDDIINPHSLELVKAEIIPETGNKECPNTGENSGDKGKSKPMTRDEIIQSLEGKEIFKPSKPINLYDVYFDRLVKGKVKNKNGESKVLGIIRKVSDDDNENVELFKRCVERADISKLYDCGRRSYARLFMNDIASLFSDPEKYRKAAHDSFGLKVKTGLSAVGGTYKNDYRLLMNGLFDDADYRKKNQ